MQAQERLDRETLEAEAAIAEAEREAAEAAEAARRVAAQRVSQAEQARRKKEAQREAEARDAAAAEEAVAAVAMCRRDLRAAHEDVLLAQRQLQSAADSVAQAETTEAHRLQVGDVYGGATVLHNAHLATRAHLARAGMAAAAADEVSHLQDMAKARARGLRLCEQSYADAERRLGESVDHARRCLLGPLQAATKKLVLAVAEGDRGVATATAVRLFQSALGRDELVRAKQGRQHIPADLELVELAYRQGLTILDLAVVCGHVLALEAEPAIRTQLDPRGEIRVSDVRHRAQELRLVVLDLGHTPNEAAHHRASPTADNTEEVREVVGDEVRV